MGRGEAYGDGHLAHVGPRVLAANRLRAGAAVGAAGALHGHGVVVGRVAAEGDGRLVLVVVGADGEGQGVGDVAVAVVVELRVHVFRVVGVFGVVRVLRVVGGGARGAGGQGGSRGGGVEAGHGDDSVRALDGHDGGSNVGDVGGFFAAVGVEEGDGACLRGDGTGGEDGEGCGTHGCGCVEGRGVCRL